LNGLNWGRAGSSPVRALCARGSNQRNRKSLDRNRNRCENVHNRGEDLGVTTTGPLKEKIQGEGLQPEKNRKGKGLMGEIL